MARNFAHRRAGFGTLTLIAVIVTVLLVTGLGQAMWRHSTQLGAYCRDAMLAIHFNNGLDFCDSLGQAIVGFQRYLEREVNASSFGGTMNLEEFSGFIARQFSSAAFGYSAPQLSGLMQAPAMPSLSGGGMLGGTSLNQLSTALSQGFQGNQLLSGGNPAQGLSFLQSSASMGEYGLLSQLQLGSVFAGGQYGIPQNMGNARNYYQQALESIQSLEQSNTPQSQQLLSAMPASPEVMKARLQQVLNP